MIDHPKEPATVTQIVLALLGGLAILWFVQWLENRDIGFWVNVALLLLAWPFIRLSFVLLMGIIRLPKQ